MNRRTIGVVTNDQRQVFQRDVIQGVHQIAEAHGYRVIVDSIAEDPDKPKPLSLQVERLAGLLVVSNVLDDAHLQELVQTNVPISLVSHCVPSLSIPAVIPDNTGGICQLVDYLVKQCGRRKLVFIRGDLRQHDGSQRDRVFIEEITRHSLDILETRMLKGDFDPKVAAHSLRELLETNMDFDGIVASDYLMGQVALEVLLENAIGVPGDVCVVAFGDGPEAEMAGLTTVAADIVELGQRAARQLLAQIDGMRIQGVTWLNTRIVERKTCCVMRDPERGIGPEHRRV